MPEAWWRSDVMIVVLLEVCRQLDMNALRIRDAQEEIAAGAMTSRSPQKWNLLVSEVIGPAQEFISTCDRIAYMINARAALHEDDGVMIIIAAQPGALS